MYVNVSFMTNKVKNHFLLEKNGASNCLELIHADLYGPMNTKSFSRSQYFLLFTNDYSRMSWVYFLKLKYKTFDNF